MAKTIELNKQSFIKKVDDFVKNDDKWNYLGDKPAVLEFYSPTCPHCIRMKPIVEELAEMHSDDIYVYKINIDVEEELSEAFSIEATPTFIFVPMKGELQIATGEMPIEELVQLCKKILLKK